MSPASPAEITPMVFRPQSWKNLEVKHGNVMTNGKRGVTKQACDMGLCHFDLFWGSWIWPQNCYTQKIHDFFFFF